ncbi:hypothetical protein SAMN02910292_00601 [Lachnospiraceae bacterium XBB2008]|nr:hypothetical protein SAMN02910292_00601 [Lachnospiraceae bacterium XBB2008]
MIIYVRDENGEIVVDINKFCMGCMQELGELIFSLIIHRTHRGFIDSP